MFRVTSSLCLLKATAMRSVSSSNGSSGAVLNRSTSSSSSRKLPPKRRRRVCVRESRALDEAARDCGDREMRLVPMVRRRNAVVIYGTHFFCDANACSPKEHWPGLPVRLPMYSKLSLNGICKGHHIILMSRERGPCDDFYNKYHLEQPSATSPPFLDNLHFEHFDKYFNVDLWLTLLSKSYSRLG